MKECTHSSTNILQSTATPCLMSQSAKQKHCYRSAYFWKSMYEQSQAIIQRSYKKSLNLEEITGLLKINKVKPKELNENKNMCVTNVHGSMKGLDIIKLVKSIENEKKEKQNRKKKIQQDKEKELFYRFKAKRVCSGIRAAKGS